MCLSGAQPRTSAKANPRAGHALEVRFRRGPVITFSSSQCLHWCNSWLRKWCIPFFLTSPFQSSMWSVVAFRLITMLDLCNAESLTTFGRKETPSDTPGTHAHKYAHRRTYKHTHLQVQTSQVLALKSMADGTKTIVTYASDGKSLHSCKSMSVSHLYTISLILSLSCRHTHIHTPCRKWMELSITKRPKWLNFPRAQQRSHSPGQHRCPGPRRESISLLYFLLTDLPVDSPKRSPHKGL